MPFSEPALVGSKNYTSRFYLHALVMVLFCVIIPLDNNRNGLVLFVRADEFFGLTGFFSKFDDVFASAGPFFDNSEENITINETFNSNSTEAISNTTAIPNEFSENLTAAFSLNDPSSSALKQFQLNLDFPNTTALNRSSIDGSTDQKFIMTDSDNVTQSTSTTTSTLGNSGDDSAATPVANNLLTNRRDADESDGDAFSAAAQSQLPLTPYDVVPPLVPRRSTTTRSTSIPTTTPTSTPAPTPASTTPTLAPADFKQQTVVPRIDNTTLSSATLSGVKNTSEISVFFAMFSENSTAITSDVIVSNSTTNFSSGDEIPLDVVVDTGSERNVESNSSSSILASFDLTTEDDERLANLTTSTTTEQEMLPTSTSTTTESPTTPVSTTTSLAILSTTTISSLPISREIVMVPIDLVTAEQRRILCGEPPKITNGYNSVACIDRTQCTARYYCINNTTLFGQKSISCRLQNFTQQNATNRQESNWENPPTCIEQSSIVANATSKSVLTTTSRVLSEEEKVKICGPPPTIKDAVPFVLCTTPDACYVHYTCVNGTVLSNNNTPLVCPIALARWTVGEKALPECVVKTEAYYDVRLRTTRSPTLTDATILSTTLPPVATPQTTTTKTTFAYATRQQQSRERDEEEEKNEKEASASAKAEKVAKSCGQPPSIANANMGLVCGSVTCTALYFCQPNFVHTKTGVRKLKCSIAAAAVRGWTDNVSNLAQCVPRSFSFPSLVAAASSVVVARPAWQVNILRGALMPCGQLPSIPHAKIVGHGKDYVRYACDHGYTSTDISTDTLLCSSSTAPDSKWNSGIIQCVPVDEVDEWNKKDRNFRLVSDKHAHGMLCHAGYRPCTNNICIRITQFCDTVPDCSDGADERDCPTYREPWEFTTTARPNTVRIMQTLPTNYYSNDADDRSPVVSPYESSSGGLSSAHDDTKQGTSRYYYNWFSFPRVQYDYFQSCESRPAPTTSACQGYYFPVYAYDQVRGECLRVLNEYGCPTTPNMFRDLSSCRAQCVAPHLLYGTGKEHCLLPASTGACPPPRSAEEEQRSVTLWYYDIKAQTCRALRYSGCNGNANRFESESACLAACLGVYLEGEVPARQPLATSVIETLGETEIFRPSPTQPPASEIYNMTRTTTTSTTTPQPVLSPINVCPPRPVLPGAVFWYRHQRDTESEEDFHTRTRGLYDADAVDSVEIDTAGTHLAYCCGSSACYDRDVFKNSFVVKCVRANIENSSNDFTSGADGRSVKRAGPGELGWQVPENYCRVAANKEHDGTKKCDNPPAVDNATSRVVHNSTLNRWEAFYRCDYGFYFAYYPEYYEPYCETGQWRHGPMPKCLPIALAADDAGTGGVVIGGNLPPPTAAVDVSNLSELALLMQFNFDRVFRQLTQIDRHAQVADMLRGGGDAVSGGSALTGSLKMLISSAGNNTRISGFGKNEDYQLRKLREKLQQLRLQTSASAFDSDINNFKQRRKVSALLKMLTSQKKNSDGADVLLA